MSAKLKILLLGPPKSGKSMIANYLADVPLKQSDEYRPTKAVRIVELESSDLEIDGTSVEAELELWDCSGSRKYHMCWPVIKHNVNGAVILCDPTRQSYNEELIYWYDMVCSIPSMSAQNVVVFVNYGQTANDADKTQQLTGKLAQLETVAVDLERHGQKLRVDFSNFVLKILSSLLQKQA